MIANSDVMSDSQMAEVDRGIIAFYRDMPPKVYFNAMKSISSPAVNYISALIASANPASEKSLSANVRHNYEKL